MSSLNSTSAFVRPAFFIISGFSNIPYVNYYYIFLLFCYAAAVVGNLLLMTVIYAVPSLHTPKYVGILNLAVADLGGSTALIPKLIDTFLFSGQKITYESCLANMFFVYFFYCMESLTLTLLAFDRFVAICFPLRYHSLVTNMSMSILITVAWLLDLTAMVLLVTSITKLSFCKSIVINSYYCDNSPLYQMACNDNSLNRIISLIAIVAFTFLPVTLIGFSYASILLALFKIATWGERIKALKTCSSHLILVSVFFMPILGIYIASSLISFNLNIRIISTSLSYVVPPVLNPIVYSLNTAEIKEFVKKMFRKNRHKGVVPAVYK